MNKKLGMLLIPLMLLPIASFGYAHFTDEVYKKYKVHVGSVYLNVTYFHVDYAKMPDVDNDGVLMGDELNITIYEAGDCRWYVLIDADPITGGFVLNTTMRMHVGGKLPVVLRWGTLWDGPSDEDLCWEEPGPYKKITGNANPDDNLVKPGGPWSWEMKIFKDNASGRFGPYGPTQTHYKPCNNITVQQHINFRQPNEDLYPGSTGPDGWQKTWECKRIRIWVLFEAEDIYGEYASWTWEDGVVTNEGAWIP